MKKKLVLHLVTTLDFGGVERRMETLAEVMGEGEMQYVFCAIGNGGITEEKLKKLNAEVICLNQRFNIPSWLAIWELFQLFHRIKPFVVHTHGAEANFHGLIAAKLAGVELRIGEEIGIPKHSKLTKLIFRLVYSAAHRVIGISQSVTNWLVENKEISSAKALRIYNPVRLSKPIYQTEKIKEIFHIGFVGRLEPVKNPVVLIEAMKVLHDKDLPCELWMIGDGSQRSLIEKKIRFHGLDRKVHLLGYQYDPVEFIRNCHIYVQPSLSEGFGLAIVEAMGCGLPIIATKTGGVSEIVEHGKTGWILENHDPDTIATALLKAWELGDEQMNIMGEEARHSVENRFTPINYLKQLEKLYCESGYIV